MQAIADNGLMLAVFNLGGGEIILVLAVALILVGAKKLPELARGLGQGLSSFRNATDDVVRAIDDQASDAGRNVGGIFGKRAAQALTPDNQVAELYDPAAFASEKNSRQTRPTLARLLETLWRRILSFLAHCHETKQSAHR
jgi:sec-independent protein translocase protein TatA